MHPYIHAKNTPNKAAFIMASSGKITTYKELDEKSNQIAHLFRKRGLKAGDGISIFMENNSKEVVIVSAVRTPIGLYKGSLRQIKVNNFHKLPKRRSKTSSQNHKKHTQSFNGR